MRTVVSALIPIVAACPLALGACDSDPAAPEDRVAVIATYNVGLAAGFVDYAEQRRPLLVELVKGLDVDVLCMQEVWTQEDVDAFVVGAAEEFPHSHYELLSDTTLGPPACEVGAATTLRACVDDKCDGVPSGELGTCVLAECQPEFFATGAGCQGCLAANIGQEVDAIFDACTTASTRYSYEGANGLLLLSRVPLSNPTHTKLDSSLVQRSVLGAQVELPRLGAVDVFCTHLAADLSSSITYNGDHGSFAGEQTHQTQGALAFIAANRRAGAVGVLAGDFNSGPALSAEVEAEIPEAAYDTLVAAGWTSLNVAAPAPACTYCRENALNGGGDPGGKLIDHVFVDGLPSAFTAAVTIFGTEQVTIASGGSDVATHPSDHYGASARFDYRP